MTTRQEIAARLRKIPAAREFYTRQMLTDGEKETIKTAASLLEHPTPSEDEIHNAAIEEAAKIADRNTRYCFAPDIGESLCAAIRSLKRTPGGA